MQVRRDGVQVLLELTGQTANNRLGVMAMQPAPVQLTWIGYPNSTGLPAVHFRLTGQVTTTTVHSCFTADSWLQMLVIPVAVAALQTILTPLQQYREFTYSCLSWCSPWSWIPLYCITGNIASDLQLQL